MMPHSRSKGRQLPFLNHRANIDTLSSSLDDFVQGLEETLKELQEDHELDENQKFDLANECLSEQKRRVHDVQTSMQALTEVLVPAKRNDSIDGLVGLCFSLHQRNENMIHQLSKQPGITIQKQRQEMEAINADQAIVNNEQLQTGLTTPPTTLKNHNPGKASEIDDGVEVPMKPRAIFDSPLFDRPARKRLSSIPKRRSTPVVTGVRMGRTKDKSIVSSRLSTREPFIVSKIGRSCNDKPPTPSNKIEALRGRQDASPAAFSRTVFTSPSKRHVPSRFSRRGSLFTSKFDRSRHIERPDDKLETWGSRRGTPTGLSRSFSSSPSKAGFHSFSTTQSHNQGDSLSTKADSTLQGNLKEKATITPPRGYKKEAYELVEEGVGKVQRSTVPSFKEMVESLIIDPPMESVASSSQEESIDDTMQPPIFQERLNSGHIGKTIIVSSMSDDTQLDDCLGETPNSDLSVTDETLLVTPILDRYRLKKGDSARIKVFPIQQGNTKNRVTHGQHRSFQQKILSTSKEPIIKKSLRLQGSLRGRSKHVHQYEHNKGENTTIQYTEGDTSIKKALPGYVPKNTRRRSPFEPLLQRHCQTTETKGISLDSLDPQKYYREGELRRQSTPARRNHHSRRQTHKQQAPDRLRTRLDRNMTANPTKKDCPTSD